MRQADAPLAWRCGLCALGLIACSNQLDLGRDIEGTGGSAGASGTPAVPTAPVTPTPTVCGQGPCFVGPVLDLAHSTGSAKGLVLDANYVFWAATAGQALMLTPRDGSATRAIPTPTAGPFDVAADDANLYFTSAVAGYVATMTKAALLEDPPAAPTLLVTAEAHPEPILAASDGVYFAAQEAGTLRRIALDGSAVETLATDISSVFELSLDDRSVYYTDSGRGEIHAVDRVTGTNTLLATGLEHPVATLPSGEQLYVLELGTMAGGYDDGRLLRMPRNGGPIEALLDRLDAPTGLARDLAATYLCMRGTLRNGYRGRIVRLADDGQLSTLAVDQAEPFAIAVDGVGVYWTVDADNGLHAILR